MVSLVCSEVVFGRGLVSGAQFTGRYPMQKVVNIFWISLVFLSCSCGEPGLELTKENLIGKWKNKSNRQITTWDLRPNGSLKVITENPSGLYPIGSVMFMEDSKSWDLKGKTIHFSGKLGTSFKILRLTKTKLRVEAHLNINGRNEKLTFTKAIDQEAGK